MHGDSPTVRPKNAPAPIDEDFDLAPLWRAVLVRGILDAGGYLASKEPERSVLVWTSRTWIFSEDFFEVAERGGLTKKEARRLGELVLERPPVEVHERAGAGGERILQEWIHAASRGAG
jgi:hypothetical protein